MSVCNSVNVKQGAAAESIPADLTLKVKHPSYVNMNDVMLNTEAVLRGKLCSLQGQSIFLSDSSREEWLVCK